MLKFILLLVYVLLILGVIFLERKSPTEALLWVTVMVCLPYVGAILYLIFGSTMAIKLTAANRGKRLQERIHVIPPAEEPEVSLDELSEEDQKVIRFNLSYNQSRLTSCSGTDIYTDGVSHYTRLFRDIRQARECIYIEFYTIHHDCVGEALVRALTEKAMEGVTVLVMCDFVANLGTPQEMFRPLLDAGGRVIRIKPYFTHYRSHRKIVTIDHSISYIGGMNIGKKYANMGEKKNPWRDTQIRMEGAASAVLEEYFLTDWVCAVKKKDWEWTVDYLQSIARPEYVPGRSLCQFIIGGVDTDKEAVKMCYLSMINSARHRIRIQTPYFIPDASILDALKTAAASGVEIQLMMPGVQSSFFLDPVTRYYVGQLLEYGAKVYRYKGYVHAKTMVVDGELCCIGSVNMDIRSLKVDDEVCGVFYANDLVEHYGKIFDEDLTHCTAYTWEEFKARPIRERFLESIYLPFAPLM